MRPFSVPARARPPIAIVAIVASLLTAAFSAQAMVGRVARQVDVLALLASGIGAGAGLAALAVTLRRRAG